MASRRFIDIGANLTDLVYNGIYNESKKHVADLNLVLQRAASIGLEKIIVTSGCKNDIIKSLKLIDEYENIKLFTTIGCHPTRCLEMNDSIEDYLNNLNKIYEENKDKIVAIGELGLDYDRLYFCTKEIQLRCFEKQLQLVKKIKLPMFLHCRNAASDMKKILNKHKDYLHSGVIHSFTGNLQEALDFIDLGYYIGINGCSLKTNESLGVVKGLPLNKILIETDAPWCDIRPTHAGFKFVKTFFPTKKKENYIENYLVKNRNEPCNIIQVFEIICSLRTENSDEIEQQIYDNTNNLFFKQK